MRFFNNYSTEPKKNNGISVFKRPDESFESLMRRFKRKIVNSQILQEVKIKQEFEKPTAKRRRKRLASIRREKENQKNNRIR